MYVIDTYTEANMPNGVPYAKWLHRILLETGNRVLNEEPELKGRYITITAHKTRGNMFTMIYYRVWLSKSISTDYRMLCYAKLDRQELSIEKIKWYSLKRFINLLNNKKL